MASFGDRVRSMDMFGAPISLQVDGRTKFKTLCGGLVSMLLGSILLGFSCLKIFAVIDYNDAKITFYEIYENRNEMEEGLNLADYKVKFFFGFMDPYYAPQSLDPSIGRF
mmetsp:Transcript_22256/g.29808  ORF Transcript_22256/g.29808 Transcript_22256/m.29808 type:complete len:110 (+) Transcript_22256:20-349(+)